MIALQNKIGRSKSGVYVTCRTELDSVTLSGLKEATDLLEAAYGPSMSCKLTLKEIANVRRARFSSLTAGTNVD